ncbi:hypothetical protein GCM10010168_37160 [Actinoplanes ianthinogenes]|uniref:Right handed beta helix domain-containing protein n=1 Tax=Actinoplanes ianthinogenes TaxID=122358 RepID=A0ABM7M552_9ACTN|nr:right-handed parallel beta-helix repeat-containing protein [Actinoplanes ianthinogenes]BCJ46762.1 hypothetical protein Aiant_74190 [Actinoplanes ianthinogenes]GGR15764.1 hypothetical protein GCM10010168_37160 [Actinoplanes ianthinogenes]
MRRIVLAVMVLVPVVALAAWALSRPSGPASSPAGYWVSAYGDDTGDGSSRHPWRSVTKAVSAVPEGATIYLRAGDYRPFTVDRPGLTITSAPGEKATVVGQSGTRDVVLVTDDDVTLRNLEVRGCVPNPAPDAAETGDHGSGVRIHGTTGVTVQNVHVHHSAGTTAAGLPVGCYGILATDARGLTVRGNEVDHNGAGIVVSGGGSGVLVDGNRVHDQDRIIHNTPGPLDDFGGYGLAATFVTDVPGPVFTNNTVEHNLGPSTDYQVDGGGIEIYDAGHVTISANTFVDNDGALETGTGSGGGCDGNVFSGNRVANRGRAGDRATGLVLRCAADMRITGNTFENLSQFTFLISTDGGFAGRIDGMSITGNAVEQAPGVVVQRLQVASATQLPRITIDANRYRLAGTAFAVVGPDDSSDAANTLDFPAWQSQTHFDATS